MPITGSQTARMSARLGVMRVGASRVGYLSPHIVVSINDVNRTALRQVRVEGLSIRDYLDGTPNTATVRVFGFTPSKGHEIKIGLGDLNVQRLIFAGHILRLTQVAELKRANVAWDLECISYEWLLNRRKVTKKYMSESATNIVLDLMADVPGFTTDAVEAALPTIDEITFTNEDLSDALDRLAQRIGAHWVVDYAKDLYFGVAASGSARSITDGDLGALLNPTLTPTTDLSQVRNFIQYEGAGSTALAALVAGDTYVPVNDATYFSIIGGRVAIAQNKVTYTGKDTGGTGAIIGAGVAAPTNPVTSAGAAGEGLGAGYYQWKTSFGTASGETLAGPASTSLLLGTTAANPTGAPSAAKSFGGGLSAGAYQWKVTFVNAGGETEPGPASSSITMDDVAGPTSIGAASAHGTGDALPNGTWQYLYTFLNPSVGVETAPSPTTGIVPEGAWNVKVHRAGQNPPAGFERQYYRSRSGGAFFRMTGESDGFGSDDPTYYYHAPDSVSAATAPSSSTAVYRQATLTNLPVSADPSVTARKLYRTQANGSTFFLAATIANNTQTSVTDSLADGSLGAVAPSTNTAVLNRASLSNIPVSTDPAVTSRKLYRTVANGGTFKLLATIANNTTTTYTDSTADGSLGANEPTTNTSGLTAAEGTVNAGASSIPVSSTGDPPFHTGGGWVRIQSQVVRYTGKSSTYLTGVPAAGQIGALTASVKYGTEILAAPMLTGVPASGAGAIEYAVVAGEAVNLVVTVEDTAAQAAMAAYLGKSDPDEGVFEEYRQDNRLSETEALSRAQARLAEVKDPLVTVSFQTRDRSYTSGREVTITLGPPTNVTGTYKIQSVTISQFDPLGRLWPVRLVEASSRRFRFEEYLRLLAAA